MKIVINQCYGGFSITDETAKLLGYKNGYDWDIDRANANLVKLVEAGAPVGGRYAKLRVVEIPDEATDWEISEYDGYEEIIYVVNGKFYHMSECENEYDDDYEDEDE